MDDAIGHASGEQNSHTTGLGAGSVGNAGCSFTGPFRGFEDENVSGQTVIYSNQFVSFENASTPIMFNHAGYDASQNWAGHQYSQQVNKQRAATPPYTERRATPEFIPNAFSYANLQGNNSGQFMPTYTAVQCVLPCNTVGFMPPNSAPISVHPNGAAGFITPANGLGFVPQPNVVYNAGNVGAGRHMPQFAGTQLPHVVSSGPTLTPAQVASRQVISRDLPIFTGNPEEWLLFISNYEQSTERCGFTNEENVIRLQKCLKGSALEAVRGKLMIPAMVPYAIGTLRMLYGRSEIVHASLQRKLKEERSIKPNNLEYVIRLALAVQNYCATMMSVGLQEYLNDYSLLSDLVAKLPSDLKLDWGRHRLAAGAANLTTFDKWLFGIAMCATMVAPYECHSTEKDKSGRYSKERLLVHDMLGSNDDGKSKAHVTKVQP